MLRTSAPRISALALLSLLAAPPSARAEDAPAASSPGAPTASAEPAAAATTLDDMTVTGRYAHTTAGSESVRARDFELRPKNRPGDLLRLVPGLFILQHQGGGKAEQTIIRGFDCDHGTDIAIFLDDVPVNMRSHAHGQGYADDHFVIPETIERVEVMKGPYDPSIGDFGTAASVRMVTRRAMQESQLSASYGMYDTSRYVAAVSRTLGEADLLGAFEYYTSDGPFVTEMDYERWNGLAKATLPLGDALTGSLLFTGFSTSWVGSGEIPERAVGTRITRFGSIDPTEGGDSQRFNLAASVRADPTEDDEVTASAYWTRYTLNLFNDFTFYTIDGADGVVDDPAHPSDEIEQNDDRSLLGGRVQAAHLFRVLERSIRGTIGADTRADIADVRLGTAVQRARTGTTQDCRIYEQSYGLYAKLEVPLAERLRAVVGGRGDYYHYDVKDRLSRPAQVEGVADEVVPGATANLIFGPWERTEVYLNFGAGHHSNDARAVVQDGSLDALPSMLSYEIGARTSAIEDRLDVGAGAYLYDLESELVLIGDEGTVEPRGRTRRVGIELEARLRLLDWIFLDGDVTYGDATFVKTGDAVPVAPRFTATSGVTARTPIGLEGSLRMRHLGERWGDEERATKLRGYTVFDVYLSYRLPREEKQEWSILTAMEAFISIENLFDTDWREAQFVFDSQLPGEAAPVTDRHFTPGVPFTLSGGLTLHF